MQEETLSAQADAAPVAATPAEETSIFGNIAPDLQPYEKSMKNARVWLYVIAAFQFGMGIFEYTQYEGLVGQVAFAIDATVALAFLLVALWSRKQPASAFTTALILYIVFTLAYAAIDVSNLGRGIIMKILVVGALIKAMKDARAYTRLRDSFGV